MHRIDLIGGQRLGIGEARNKGHIPGSTGAVDVDAGLAVQKAGDAAGHRSQTARQFGSLAETFRVQTEKHEMSQHTDMLPRWVLQSARRATDTVCVQPAPHSHPADFRDNAATYARIRPGYPPALFARLKAWLGPITAPWVLDVGAGSGQATRDLATWPNVTVAALDREPAMLRAWPPPPAVLPVVGAAEALPFRDETFDLVVAAQAAHWFDFATFAREALRVLRSGGVAAIWTYGLIEIEPAIDVIIRHLHDITLGADWEPGRRHVVERYSDLRFPMRGLDVPALTLEQRWELNDLAAYLSTWSALARYRRRTGHDPLPAALSELRDTWGAGPRSLCWPLTIHAVRKPP